MAETRTGAEQTEKKPPRPRRTARRKANGELVRSFFEALAARDPERMAQHWSPDLVQDLVPLGVFRGREEIKGIYRELFAAAPDLETTVQRVVTDEQHAVVEWRMTGTFSGRPFQGLDPTGRRVELRGVDVYTIDDGAFTAETSYYDGMAFARGVGMMPARDSGAERAMKSAFNAVTKVRKVVNERMGSSP
jgi:steroid delta-isomerase-like uncharacterized protein